MYRLNDSAGFSVHIVSANKACKFETKRILKATRLRRLFRNKGWQHLDTAGEANVKGAMSRPAHVQDFCLLC